MLSICVFSSYSTLSLNRAASGCDDQVAPQTGLGSMVGLAVRVNLPAIGIFHSLWSVTKISIPLKRTSVSTVTDLRNYHLVFYLDNGAPYPYSVQAVSDLYNGITNLGLPLPGSKVGVVSIFAA